MAVVHQTSSADVAVIGGGAVGACVAADLAGRGASVVLLERGSDLAAACSAGNAGIVGASHVWPLAGREAVLEGLRWMGRRDSPFAVTPRPTVLPWLARFLRASTAGRVAHSARVLRELALVSARMHLDWHAGGLDSGLRRNGLLNVYGGEREFAAARRQAQADAREGLPSQILDGAAARSAHPGLRDGIAGTVLYPDEAHCDPARFVRAVGDRARSAGARLRTGVEVLGLRTSGSRVDSLWTTAGDLAVGEVVLATGAWVPELAADLGLALPVEGGKGYHVELPREEGDPEPAVWFQDSRVVVTPLDGRVRVAGTLVLAGRDTRVDRVRAHAVRAAGDREMPALRGRRELAVWRGLRPCTPDGLPIIGRPRGAENVVVAGGHGMWGLQLGPITGQLVGELITGAPPSHDLEPLSPGRFRRR